MKQPQVTRHVPMPEHPCYLEIDVGSTTIKAVVLDGETILFADYRRHNADVRAELTRLLSDIAKSYPGLEVHAAIIGSGDLATVSVMGISFIQKVIAGTELTRCFHPGVDVVIEFSGGDAKLTYLHSIPEQHMNGTCAGGTGVFTDQVATLFRADASGLNKLAAKRTQLYPIASCCGIFARSDIQPLINQGAAYEDLAASILTAVAIQTVAGLACGRLIRGTVMFLGGPLHFLPGLCRAYRELLPKAKAFAAPENAQLYAVIGAALLVEREQRRALTSPDSKGRSEDTQLVSELVDILTTATIATESARMCPLFVTEAEREEFRARHAEETIPRARIDEVKGRC